MSEAKSPFIIWTLQRTGGTNLTRALVKLSGLPGTEHEPFNVGRVYGRLTQDWLDKRDRKQLDRAVEQIIDRRQIIKHCVETVPWEVSEALARASTRAGYRHVFLHRRNAGDRLLSLHFAEKSGMWGPTTASGPSGEAARANAPAPLAAADVLSAPLPVAKLASHERKCRERLTAASRLLRRLEAEPLALAYEDLYRATDAAQPVGVMAPILRALNLMQGEPEIGEWTAALIAEGDQGTRDKYELFPGVAELKKLVEGIPPFELNALAIQCRPIQLQEPWVDRFFVDVLPASVDGGRPFEIGGVLVLGPEAPNDLRLTVTSPAGCEDLQWDIGSPRIERECPGARNAARARWRGLVQLAGEADVLTIALRSDTATVPVAQILRVEDEDEDQIYKEKDNRLVLDVGANDGADTWYYLRKGFRVVAVEAVPDLADRLRERFASQLTANRLIVVQKAIAAAAGTVDVTFNRDRTEWSSAHQASKASAGDHDQVSVPAVTLADIIRSHGRPYYVKIDIEGGELDAVRSLAKLPAKMLPPFMSIEKNRDVFEVLQMLWDLSYREFQLVRQGAEHLPALPSPSREGLDYPCGFSSNMSGPFGNDLPGTGWVGLVEIIRRVLEENRGMASRLAAGTQPGWYDIHARMGGR